MYQSKGLLTLHLWRFSITCQHFHNAPCSPFTLQHFLNEWSALCGHGLIQVIYFFQEPLNSLLTGPVSHKHFVLCLVHCSRSNHFLLLHGHFGFPWRKLMLTFSSSRNLETSLNQTSKFKNSRVEIESIVCTITIRFILFMIAG